MHAAKKLAPLHSSLGTFVAADKVTITPSFGDWQEVEQSWVLDKDYAPLVPSGKMIYYTEGKCSVSLRMTAIFSLCRSGLAPPASRQSRSKKCSFLIRKHSHLMVSMAAFLYAGSCLHYSFTALLCNSYAHVMPECALPIVIA